MECVGVIVPILKQAIWLGLKEKWGHEGSEGWRLITISLQADWTMNE